MKLTDHTKNWLFVVPGVVLLNASIMIGFSIGWWDLAWYRSSIEQGEIWRLITGHFQHLSWNHWLMNQLGFALILWLLPMLLSRFRWLLACVVGSVFISLGLWFTDIQGYVGLSGLLYTLLFYGTLIDRSIPFKVKSLLLSAVLLKVVVEQFWPGLNQSTEDYIGGFVAVDAHLFGSIVGILMAIAERFARQKRSTMIDENEDV